MYSEGWALYSETLPKEVGLYRAPYSDYGRLSGELWRACRLVVDTGIHHYRWTREESIEYYRNNTANPDGECVKMVERHIVWPGQAVSYKIGMLKIQELRKYFVNVNKDENFETSLKNLAESKKEVFDFFDNVMVNDGEQVIKKNRLELLQMLCKTYENYLNFSKIESL